MARRGGLIIILIALILLVVVVAAYIWLQMQGGLPGQAQPQATPTPQNLVNIVITTQFIARGSEITEGSVTTIPYPREQLVEGTFITEIESVYGKRAKYDLERGIPLTPGALVEPGAGSIVSFDIPKEFVALPIPVSSLTSVSYALQPGDHVMVIGCMLLVDVDQQFQSRLPNKLPQLLQPGPVNEPESITTGFPDGSILNDQGRTELDPTLNQSLYAVPSEPQRPRLVCQTIIQDAVVLRLGAFSSPQVAAAQQQPSPTPQPGQTTPTTTTTSLPDSVTLVVSPEDAVILNFMMLEGIKINLALRNPTDTKPIVTDAVTLQYLMDQKNIPLPAKLPFAVEPRVDKLEYPLLPSEIMPTPAP
ncbi:Flp pilus assembly protein CpaB [Thermanaerothrix sp.]|uniref:Flp pilus assembly protein CpaB n=1 Tax=Thermanaerothrix sp. TaxID=2972675 RepID=UPI002ADE5CBC|nr:SAF domain-containing protein [Thermanaerothrix sp.]